ncbi:hypothetical protein ADL00_05975 [Streptomyces sp. AS58]|uniref:hypothetical protein n=1 Tax=Streptomyces sp. AS58 TaxID=1519489 RepID=UPI0006AE4098|nr:hypothetical protein [Streptomyces sp. AS58]KOV72290.1 hypothetical protein ADL00_05975 [Streptomyces sp. AS58]
MHSVNRNLLNRLADDRTVLTRLVFGVLADLELAPTRVTLLSNRLSLYEAPDGSLDIRLDLDPQPDNQLFPHDHRYSFATRILIGGYIRVVRHRTNGRHSPFTRMILASAVLTIERPVSAYTLNTRSCTRPLWRLAAPPSSPRRRKKPSHALEELMPAQDSWPAPVGSRAVRRRVASSGRIHLAGDLPAGGRHRRDITDL